MAPRRRLSPVGGRAEGCASVQKDALRRGMDASVVGGTSHPSRPSQQGRWFAGAPPPSRPERRRRRQPCSTEERAGPGPAHAPLASIATASEWSRGSAPRRGRRSLSQWSERIGRRGNGLGLAGRGPRFGRPRSKADHWISSNGCAYCGHVNGPRGAIWAESVAGLRPKLGQSSRNTGLPKRFFSVFQSVSVFLFSALFELSN